jgi:hypothetical protein
MKKRLTTIKLFLLAAFFMIAVPTMVFSQPQPDSNDVDIPIDGGISLLIAAGAVAGAKKIKDARKK